MAEQTTMIEEDGSITIIATMVPSVDGNVTQTEPGLQLVETEAEERQ